MTILIANDGFHAHYFERMAWYNALTASGIQCAFYNCKESDAFEIFDRINPSIFIGQLYNVDRATVKCIKERPYLKVALRAGHYSSDEKLMNNPHMLTVRGDELNTLEEICDNVNFLYCHYLQKDMEATHDLFRGKFGVNVLGVPMSADVISYADGVYDKSLECDIAFVGGYWPYKGRIIDEYLMPLLTNYNYKVKIFGNQPWPANQYCGTIEEQNVKNLFASAHVCPNLSEPHAHEFGFDVNERAFKILMAGGVCVMDNVRAAKDIFGEHVLFANTPKEFAYTIDNIIYAKKDFKIRQHIEKSKKFILNNHTSFHRLISMFGAMEEKELKEKVKNALNNYILEK